MKAEEIKRLQDAGIINEFQSLNPLVEEHNYHTDGDYAFRVPLIETLQAWGDSPHVEIGKKKRDIIMKALFSMNDEDESLMEDSKMYGPGMPGECKQTKEHRERLGDILDMSRERTDYPDRSINENPI